VAIFKPFMWAPLFACLSMEAGRPMAGWWLPVEVGQECCRVLYSETSISSVPNEPSDMSARTVRRTSHQKRHQARCLSWVQKRSWRPRT
jgi:hypothetical protein